MEGYSDSQGNLIASLDDTYSLEYRDYPHLDYSYSSLDLQLPLLYPTPATATPPQGEPIPQGRATPYPPQGGQGGPQALTIT